MTVKLTPKEIVEMLTYQILARHPGLSGISVEASARIRTEGTQAIFDGIDLTFNEAQLPSPQTLAARKAPPTVSIATLIEQVNTAGVVECVLTDEAWATLKAQSPQFKYYEIDRDRDTKSRRMVVGRSQEDLEVFLDRG